MRLPPWSRLGLVLLVMAGPAARSGGAEEKENETAEAEAFFEAKIRPLLAERCWKCHGAEKQWSGLRLDSRAAALKGGDNGPAVVPGKPEESVLLTAVRHEDELLKMPPKADKLPDTAIADLDAWIRMGAPWPEAAGIAAAQGAAEPGEHWAFRPVRRPDVPEVSDPKWVASPVDAFILARLDESGLAPSPMADRRTLIRRVTFDLTGLPPSPEEVERFLADDAADAYDRLVERLLASPRYGERWGRHWLDVARYADSKGYVFQEESKYPYSYTYRDYVVRAFNEDKPYDEFILEQVAADRLPGGGDPGRLAALGFLTVGRRFLNNKEDIIDDRIDVVSRGLLGLTVACARCHDHKYDPIPTQDYYSLYGVFASCEEPRDLPVIGASADADAARAYEAERAKRQAEVDTYMEGRRVEYEEELRERLPDYLRAAHELDYERRGDQFDERAREDTLRPELLRRLMEQWRGFLDAKGGPASEVLAAWNAFAALPAEGFAEKAAEVASDLVEADGSPLSRVVAGAVAEAPPEAMGEVVRRYGDLFARALGPDEEAEPDPGLAPLRGWLEGAGGPIAVATEEVRRLVNRAERDKLRGLEKDLAGLDVTHPGAPPRAMVLVDRPELYEPRVFLRGSPSRPGEAVPRRFLAVLSGPDRKPFADGSGRLDLARAIARPDNPLTARVMVNRIWMHHFGAGLVRTPSDFGTRSDPPSHPELLDYLADAFVRGGWSVKAMHRLILHSSTYRQQSTPRPEGLAADPQDLLLWRQSRRRLEFEALRDALLAASGRLDERMGGRPVGIVAADSAPRRTVYGFIDRRDLPGLFRTFDFASPDASTPQRPVTTVPQQALFLMNSPFAMDQARHLAARSGGADDAAADRIRRLYRRLFGRDPEPTELELGARFVEPSEPVGDPDGPSRWEVYAQALMMTNEFLFVD